MRKVQILLVGICGLLLGLTVVTYFFGVLNILPETFQLDYAEGYIWQSSLNFAQGEPLYQEITSEPFLCTAYTPIFFMVEGLLIKIFGSSLLWGRLISVVAGVVLAVLVFLIVNRLTGSKVAGLLASMLFFTIPIFRLWSVVNRVDLLALVLEAAGLLLVVKFVGTRKILWAVPFLVLAFFTKQTYVVGLIAISVYLLWKYRKSLLPFLSLYFVLLLVGAGLIYLAWGTTAFLDIIVRSSSLPWMFSYGYKIGEVILTGMLPLVGLALVYVILRIRGKQDLGLLSIYWIVCLIYNLFITSRLGAFANGYLETCLATCLLVGCLLGETLGPIRERLGSLPGKLNFDKMLPIVVFLALVCVQALPTMTAVLDYPAGTAKVYRNVSELIGREEGPILAVNATFLLREGRETNWEPATIAAGGMTKKSHLTWWDQTHFVQRLETGYYSLVILNYDVEDFYIPGSWSNHISHTQLTEEMADAVRDNFVPIYHSGGLSQVPQGVTVYQYRHK